MAASKVIACKLQGKDKIKSNDILWYYQHLDKELFTPLHRNMYSFDFSVCTCTHKLSNLTQTKVLYGQSTEQVTECKWICLLIFTSLFGFVQSFQCIIKPWLSTFIATSLTTAKGKQILCAIFRLNVFCTCCC